MYKSLLILTLALAAIPLRLNGQSRYEVELADFSTRKYDEFCPVIYKDQVVYCSNQRIELLIAYQNQRKMSLFNIFKVNITDVQTYSRSEVFSQNLATPFNDGPVAFAPGDSTLVYSRNIDTKTRARNMVDLNNNLGLFFAEFKNGEWMGTSGFKYNNSTYSITTPCYSPDGLFLYFSSNKPGGFGGTDLYRSKLLNREWSEPENLGEKINTAGNEVYPFIAGNGDLFFASDGHGGLGKKDLYVTKFSENDWITPIHLEAPINSPEDDFGLFTDADQKRGYISSNRGINDDIYIFNTLVPQLFDCNEIQENQYCFEFWDEQSPETDTLTVSYEWEFSDGARINGLRVVHCLPGAGTYWAKLNVIDNTTDSAIMVQSTMDFEIVDHIQPYITSSDTVIVDEIITFSGLNSNLPGFIIEEYIWDFGDGSFEKGAEVKHQYKDPGTYSLKLGVKGNDAGSTDKETRCVTKPVIIVDERE